MKKSDLMDLLSTVLEVKNQRQPSLTDELMEEIVMAEKLHMADPAEAQRLIENAIEKMIASMKGSNA